MILINIDSVNCAGKSTLVNALIKHYTEKGHKVGTKHFPDYQSPIGALIHKALMKEIDIDSESMQHCANADRLEFTKKVYPNLQKDYTMFFLDRYTSSGLVYGQLEGVDPDVIISGSKNLVKPDVNIILFIEPEIAFERLEQRNEARRKYDNLESIRKANKLYLELNKYIDNCEYIDASQTREEVLAEAIQIIDHHLNIQNNKKSN